MYKKYIFSVLLYCLGLLANAQDSNDILMIVAEKMISVADFQAAYQRNTTSEAGNTKDEITDFLKQYVNLQLQIAEAEAIKLDTLPVFRQQMQTWAAIEGGNEEWKKAMVDKPCVQIAHLFIPLHQHASFSEQEKLRARMDSVHNVIRQGADFMQVASQIKPGQACIKWLGQNQTLADVEAMAFRLSEGELSSPLLSTDGFHLMKCIKVGISDKEQTAAARVISQSAVQQQEYRAGLLVRLLYDKEIRGKAEQDELGLLQYFTENQKKYAWDVPRYMGVVYQSKNKKAHKTVKKLLSKQPMSRWQSIIEDPTYQHVFQDVKITPVRLFKLGENEQLDELAFGGPKATPDKDYPLYGILGKEQKKYPENLKDVETQVKADYQAHLEREWLDNLRKRHEVTINEKALKTLYR